MSFLQLRGSVPIRWVQIIDGKYKPKLSIDIKNSEIGFKKHMEKMEHEYGSVIMVNLVDKVKYEEPVGKIFSQSSLKFCNPKTIEYIHFDFHKECKGMRFDRVNLLVDQIKSKLDKFGSFIINPTKSQTPIKIQTGIVRSNCMDCLDRTNVVQSVLATDWMIMEFRNMKLLDKDENFDTHPEITAILRTIWADNADYVSLAYSGTGALKTDFTRTGQRTKLGLLNDGYNSVERYIRNNFMDGYRQDAYDLLLGDFRVPEEYVAEVNKLSTEATVLLYTIAFAAFLLLATFIYPPSSGFFSLKTLFRLIILSSIVAYGVKHLIKTHEYDLLSWPSLKDYEYKPPMVLVNKNVKIPVVSDFIEKQSTNDEASDFPNNEENEFTQNNIQQGSWFDYFFEPRIRRELRRFSFIIVFWYFIILASIFFSVLVYALFYYIYMPVVELSKPVHFRFSENGAAATIDLLDHGKPNKLSNSQVYNIELYLKVPTSETNQNIGNFMASLELYNTDNELSETSARTGIVAYRSGLIRQIHGLVFFFPMILANIGNESEEIYITLAEGVTEFSRHASKAIISLSTAKLQVYSAEVRVYAVFSGIRYYMYYWKVPTAFIFISASFTIQFGFALLSWILLGQYIKTMETSNPEYLQSHEDLYELNNNSNGYETKNNQIFNTTKFDDFSSDDDHNVPNHTFLKTINKPNSFLESLMTPEKISFSNTKHRKPSKNETLLVSEQQKALESKSYTNTPETPLKLSGRPSIHSILGPKKSEAKVSTSNPNLPRPINTETANITNSNPHFDFDSHDESIRDDNSDFMNVPNNQLLNKNHHEESLEEEFQNFLKKETPNSNENSDLKKRKTPKHSFIIK
ncbi:hypothetical protein BB558_006301 [Smittium angustum]|uniref:SAC domain-containing protein n=1 Tax=Smittium angustum TaxID=133377 RepID=A0A2U1IY54_SMIAN|nr:hypothetical protein BB558_006301 [Smittium angustum]